MSIAVVGILLAGFAAVANSAATLLESAATGLGRSGARRGRGGRWEAVSLYLLGLVVDLLGWVLTVAALRFLPIFAVQSIVAEQVAITVLVGGRLLGLPVRRRDVLASAATVIGLAVIAASGTGTAPATPTTGLVPILGGMVGIGLLAGGVLYRRHRWLGFTVLAGTCFSATAVVARGVHVPPDGVRAVDVLVREPAVWLMVLLGGVGTLIYVAALAKGPPGPVLAVLSVTEVLLPGAVGIALLGDTVRPGWLLPCLLALTTALIGTAVLALSPTQKRVLDGR